MNYLKFDQKTILKKEVFSKCNDKRNNNINQKLKINNKERYFNVYDDSNVIIMDKKLENMKKRI